MNGRCQNGFIRRSSIEAIIHTSRRSLTRQLIECDLNVADASDFSITDRRRHSRRDSFISLRLVLTLGLSVLLSVSSPEYDYRESESVNILKRRLASYLLEIEIDRRLAGVLLLSVFLGLFNYFERFNFNSNNLIRIMENIR